MYVRKDLTAALNPIHSTSRDLATCTITLNGSTYLISNVYNAPRTFDGLEAWNTLMTSLPLSIQLLPTVVVMDANLHSPLWDPPHSDAHNKDADSLVEMMARWNLKLRSPLGVPTFGLGSSTTCGTTIDLVWVNEQLDDVIQACLVDTDDVTNHLSDHQSLITAFATTTADLTSPPQENARRKNWNKVEVPTLLTELSTSLPAMTRLTTQADIDTFDRQLRQAIINALNNNLPNRAPMGKHKRWWRPDILDPLRKEARKAHRAFKANKTDENKVKYNTARNTFNKTADRLKENSWRSYLSTLTHDTLFQAKKFASGRKPSSLVNTLVSKDGKVCSTNKEKADLLFETTCVATAPCRISEAKTISFPLDTEARPSEPIMTDFFDYLSEENVKAVIFSVPPLKAPGADLIPNWVWQMVWPIVKHHVHTLFLQITANGLIPQDWKVARTIMIPKPGKLDYTAALAYRPIALLLTLSKIYEKLLTKHLSEQVESKQLLHEALRR